MAYSKEVVARARQRLESMKADRESEYLQRLQSAYRQQPRLKEIDLALRKSMSLAAQAVFLKGGDARQAMEQVKTENLALQQERQQLVERCFGSDYLDEKPICSRCGGAGYVGSAMCVCLGELCRQEQKKVLADLGLQAVDFSAFRLDLYPDRPDPQTGVSPRTVMEKTLNACRKYAYSFGKDSGNLLMSGQTGLGKTFLSACIAGVVIDRGFSVVYESAHNLIAKLEKDRFRPDQESHSQAAQIRDCDLLILDDLGTELPGGFVNAALYTLLNDRLMAGKAIIVSTNFGVEELGRRYTPQIASRLLGNFKHLVFLGEDIRIMKSGRY